MQRQLKDVRMTIQKSTMDDGTFLKLHSNIQLKDVHEMTVFVWQKDNYFT